jgi:hypothetical protein
LAGFGIERFILYGKTVPPSSREWEDRLSLTGWGQAQYSNLRSITDTSGEPIGCFETSYARSDVVDIIRLVEQVGLMDTPPFRIEPNDMRIRMTMVLGGIAVVKYLGVHEPDRLAALFPLMDRLQQMEQNLKRCPVRALSVEVQMPREFEVGLQRVPVVLRLRNTGREPYWIAHPRALNRGSYSERCALSYGHKPEPVPGMEQYGIEVVESPLLAEKESGVQLIWMPAGGVQECQLITDLNFYKRGQFVARAVLSSYDGEDRIGGIARLRGCVFSQDLTLDVF